jgi:hypothetical protein
MRVRLVQLLALSLVACSKLLDIDGLSNGRPDASVAGTAGTGGSAGVGGCEVGQSSCSGSCVDLKTDDENCGVCSRSCLGGTCDEGRCSAVQLGAKLVCHDLSLNAAADELAVTAWRNDESPDPAQGGLYTMSLEPNSAFVDVTTGVWGATFIDRHATGTFFANETSNSNEPAGIRNGATLMTLTNQKFTKPYDVLVVGDYLLWSDKDEPGIFFTDLSQPGSEQRTLADASWVQAPYGLAYLNGTVFVADSGPALDTGRIVSLEFDPTAPPGGDAQASGTELSANQKQPYSVAARVIQTEGGSETEVFFTHTDGMSVIRGEQPVFLGGTKDLEAGGIVTTDDWIYWSQRDIPGFFQVQVWRTRSQPGSAEALWSGGDDPDAGVGLTVHEGVLYFCADALYRMVLPP